MVRHLEISKPRKIEARLCDSVILSRTNTIYVLKFRQISIPLPRRRKDIDSHSSEKIGHRLRGNLVKDVTVSRY